MASQSGIEAPSGMLVGQAIKQFTVSLAAVIAAVIGEDDQELGWLRTLWNNVCDDAANWEFEFDLDEDFPDDWPPSGRPNHLLPLDIVLNEIAYFCVKFRPLTLSVWAEGEAPFTDSPEAVEYTQPVANVPQSSSPTKANVETGEVILDSIGKVLESLPSWARKILHGLMEALKIIRLQP